MFFPRKGTLTDAGDWGGVGGPFMIKNLKSHKKSGKHIFSYIFPPEGNFDIDAGDGGEQIPKIPKFSTNKWKRKIRK